MKTLKVSSSKLDAEMTVGLLKAHGIEAFINGSREYASVITGADSGRYEIEVREDDAEDAQAVIDQLSESHEQQSDELPPKEESPTPESLLKRAFIFAFLASFWLPIIFNVVSINNLRRYLKVADKQASTYLAAFAVLVVNLGGLLLIYFFLARIFKF